MTTRRISLVLTVLFAVALVGGTSAAAAGGKTPVRIETHGVLTGPASVAGTFAMTGAVSDSGTFVDSFSLDGDTIRVIKTLSGSKGTFTLRAKGAVVMTSPTAATFTGGSWRVLSGTGAYADLQGRGRPGAVGTVNFATGTVDVVHEGRARL
jgi:hypothetical protein